MTRLLKSSLKIPNTLPDTKDITTYIAISNDVLDFVYSLSFAVYNRKTFLYYILLRISNSQ